jgi:HK97 gp10 family phage protein
MLKVTMDGIDDLNKKILQMLKGISPEVAEPILRKSAIFLRDDIRQRAPLGPTGNLKAALLTATLKMRKGELCGPALVAINKNKAPHAHLVEYGHAGPHPAPPHPFFRPGWDANKGKVEQDITEGLIKSIEKAV